MRDYALLLSLLVIMVFFQFTTDGTLFKPVNMTNIILQNSYIVVMALGMLLVIVAGHIDLSVGSVSGFIGAVAALMMTGTMPFYPGRLHGIQDSIRYSTAVDLHSARRRRSARCRAISSPITRFRPSS